MIEGPIPHPVEFSMQSNDGNGIDPADWLPLVYKVVGLHSFRQEADKDDATQYGMAALVRAAQLWTGDHESKATFKTYAWECVRGSIKSWRRVEVRFRRMTYARKKTMWSPRVEWTVGLHLFSECDNSFVRGWNRVFAREASEDDLDRDHWREKFGVLLESLSDREKRVIEMRYGLGGDEPRTFQNIADVFGLTMERIRQIQVRGERKLRDYFDKNPEQRPYWAES